MHIAGDHKHVNGDRILFKDAVYVYRGNKWKVDRSAEATRMLGQNFHWVGTGAATGVGGIPFPVSRIGHRDARLTTGGKGLLIGGDNMASAVIMRSNGNFTLDKNGQLVPFKRDPKKRNLPRYFYAQSESAQNQLNMLMLLMVSLLLKKVWNICLKILLGRTQKNKRKLLMN